MTLSRGIKNFWIQIGRIVLASTAFALVGFLWFGWRAAVLIGLIGLFGLFSFLQETKSRFFRGLSGEWNARPVSLETFSLIDLDWLQQQTIALESLGFVQLMDYERLECGQTLARCLAHPQQYCFAEIGQLVSSSDKPPLKHSSISSLLDEGWRLGVANREPSSSVSLNLLYRNPKVIGIHDPNPRMEEVFEAHLRTRQQIISDLGITVLTDVSRDAYVRFN